MTGIEQQRMEILQRFEPVQDLEVVVWEEAEAPQSIGVAILGTFDGWTDITQIDKSDPGARARTISLAEIIHDTLQSAECAWFAE